MDFDVFLNTFAASYMKQNNKFCNSRTHNKSSGLAYTNHAWTTSFVSPPNKKDSRLKIFEHFYVLWNQTKPRIRGRT